MEAVKSFLDSSTIHGLAHISSTRKFVRICWIIVVFAGFCTAGYLIQTSFNNWEKSPISTTIETLPISEITFPNVTVCPPKQSYLDLNYDILESEKIAIDKETRIELIDSTINILQETLYEEILTNLNKFVDPNRYYNWYLGFTKVKCPYFNKIEQKISYRIDTTATSGNISTKYFGEIFDVNKVDRIMEIKIKLDLQESMFVAFDIEKISMDRINGIDQFVFGDWLADKIDANVRHIRENVTGETYRLEIERNISLDDIRNVNLKLMPGFMLTWYSDKKAIPVAEYIDSNVHLNDEFIR